MELRRNLIPVLGSDQYPSPLACEFGVIAIEDWPQYRNLPLTFWNGVRADAYELLAAGSCQLESDHMQVVIG